MGRSFYYILGLEIEVDLSHLLKGVPVARFLKELALFVLSPKRFLQIVRAEDGTTTWVRLAVYAAAFVIVEVSIFSAALTGALRPDKYALIGLAIGEIVLGLVYVPVFWLLGAILRTPKPLKTATVFSITFRFVWLTVPLVLYGLFIISEDYSFALLRGVAVWIYWLAWLVTYPLIITDGLRKRAAAAAISLTLGVLWTTSAQSLMAPFSTSNTTRAHHSLLFDPIGAEVNAARLSFNLLNSGNSEVARAAKAFLRRPTRESADSAQERADREQAVLNWVSRRSVFRNSLQSEAVRLDSAASRARFQTTLTGIQLERAVIDSASALLDAMDDAYRAPTLNNLLRISDTYVGTMDATNEGLSWTLRQADIRVRLFKLQMLEN